MSPPRPAMRNFPPIPSNRVSEMPTHAKASMKTGRRRSRSAGEGIRTRGAQARSYVRETDLPKLLPLWPSELEVRTPSDHLRLLARLRRALRAERRRGLSGHWTYDLSRHAQLLRAYRAEAAACLSGAGSQR